MFFSFESGAKDWMLVHRNLNYEIIQKLCKNKARREKKKRKERKLGLGGRTRVCLNVRAITSQENLSFKHIKAFSTWNESFWDENEDERDMKCYESNTDRVGL